jgi:hypothetical protein
VVKVFLSSIASKPTEEPPFSGIKRISASSAEVKMAQSCTYCLSYFFMPWYLIRQKNVTLPALRSPSRTSAAGIPTEFTTHFSSLPRMLPVMLFSTPLHDIVRVSEHSGSLVHQLQCMLQSLRWLNHDLLYVLIQIQQYVWPQRVIMKHT